MEKVIKSKIAYFSMEIGISKEIPTYSGGLGVLAGDTLRSAADLELPIIGVTLLYKKGYFHQKITPDGDQIESPVRWNPLKKLDLLHNEVTVRIYGRDVKVKAWHYPLKGVTGYEVPIIFLDTDISPNSPEDREITHYLYGKDNRYRLMQEIILGIGGVKMLKELDCLQLHNYHMNEGHSSLLAVELYKREQGEKIKKVRRKCVFTTHTPVPAGHDSFPRQMVEEMIGDYIPEEIKDEVYTGDTLNMTHVGLRFSKYINGVAKKHGEVSRLMFPGFHIDSITNGIHSQFWTCDSMKELFDKYIPGWRKDPFNLRYVLSIPSSEVHEAHQKEKEKLFNIIKEKYSIEMDKDVFTIGFARRAATYKRGDMLFSDTENLIKIAKKFKGLQIIFGGKAHPNDGEGKAIIKRIVAKMKEIEHEIKVCYVEDYDIDIAKQLVAGVDIWLNTPQRPKEASGTSGMKAAVNGVPHFSVLDGWWIEGYIKNVTGWSIGHDDKTAENDNNEDVSDLYEKLEHIILPRYYETPEKWINTMRHCIAMNGSFFNTHRMVQQYVLNAYFKQLE
jgi:glycogen phosphorylase